MLVNVLFELRVIGTTTHINFFESHKPSYLRFLQQSLLGLCLGLNSLFASASEVVYNPNTNEQWSINDWLELANKQNSVLSQTGYLLLGEEHNNPVHAQLFQKIASSPFFAERQPNIVLQMLLESRRQDAESTIPAKWNKAIYQPILDSFDKASLEGASLNRSELKQLRTRSISTLTMIPQFKTIAKIQPVVIDNINQDIRATRSAINDQETIQQLTRVYLGKDAKMAFELFTSIQSSTQSNPLGILFADNYHVRKDRGVPIHLALLQHLPHRLQISEQHLDDTQYKQVTVVAMRAISLQAAQQQRKALAEQADYIILTAEHSAGAGH